jgi:hypothetical protein
MGEPQPSSWGCTSAGELRPIEFSYTRGPKVDMNALRYPFVAAFKRWLAEKGVTDLFGLCVYLGDDFKSTCEITMDAANINLKPKDVSCSFGEANYSDWSFAAVSCRFARGRYRLVLLEATLDSRMQVHL